MTEPTGREFQQAQKTVWRLLKIRGRSEQEIIGRLKRKNFADDVITQTLGYFKDLGFINDQRFARDWINARLNRPFGLSRIRYELKHKGLAADIIKDELDRAAGEHDELDVLRKLVKQRKRQYEGIEPAKAKQRLVGYLSRKGFSIGNILKVIREAS
jgi:regulatory protein